MCERGAIMTLWREYRDCGARMPDAFASGPFDRPCGIRDFTVLDPDGCELVPGAPIDRGDPRGPA